MTLGKRALILIFPVVLAGYLLAALSVHVAQSRSIRALEHAKLSQRLEHAAAVFQNEVGRSTGFLNALLNGNSLRQYVSETDKNYRANALGVRLQESVTSLSDDPTGYVSLAILTSNLQSEYYFENSWDPFAEIDEAQLNLARRLITRRQACRLDLPLRRRAQGRGSSIPTSSIPLPSRRPLPSKKSSALLIQVAVQPDRFLDMQATLKQEYGADDRASAVAAARLPTTFRQACISGHRCYATLTVSSDHFDAADAPSRNCCWRLVPWP